MGLRIPRSAVVSSLGPLLCLALACAPGQPTAADAGAPDAELGPAGGLDGAQPQESGDGGPGADCSFNRDCIGEARCACTLERGCACELGPRGTGRAGIDPCQTGDDCASSLCVEGAGGAFYCSGECLGPEDCGVSLPQCLEVALLGRICARQGP